MKSKIKRGSRSALSIVLAVCMLISCMTVGLIATDAAQTLGAVGASEDEANVGADLDTADDGEEAVGVSGTVYIQGSFGWTWVEMYKDSGGDYFYPLDSLSSGGEWKFKYNSTQYGSTSDEESTRKINLFGSNNGKSVGSNRTSTFRNNTGTYSSGITIWVKSDLSKTWLTNGKTSLPVVTVNLDASSAASKVANVTVSGSSSGTSISSSSGTTSGSFRIGETATVTVESIVGYIPKKVSVGGTAYDLTKSGSNYSYSFTVPGSETTVDTFTFDRTVVDAASISANKTALSSADESATITVTVKGSKRTNDLTFTLKDSDDNVIGTQSITSGNSVTFDVTPNVKSKTYYAVVSQTGGTDYVSVKTDNITITNSYYIPQYTVTFAPDDADHGTVTASVNGLPISSGASVPEGSTVTFKATPKDSYAFSSWTGISPTTSVASVTVTGNLDVTGNFVVPEAKYSIDGLDGNGGNWDHSYSTNVWHVDNYTSNNIFYTKVYLYNPSNNDIQANRFRLVKKGGNTQYRPSSSTSLSTSTENKVVADATGVSTWFYITYSTNGTYRIYVDQTDENNPKVWVTEDRECYIAGGLTVTDGDIASEPTAASFSSAMSLHKLGSSADSSTYTFALSDVKNPNYNYAHYKIIKDKNVGVDFTTDFATIGGNEEKVLCIYNVQAKTNCSNVVLHIDSVNKTIYATATYNKIHDNKKTMNSTEKVRYYFAQHKSEDSEGEVDGITNGIMIEYYNNSIARTEYGNERFVEGEPVNVNGAKCSVGSDNTIYVDCTHLMNYTLNGKTSMTKFSGWTNNTEFYIYYIDLPVSATSFNFVKKDSDHTWVGQEQVVLNPNRVYLSYEYGGTNRTSSVILDKSLWSQNDTSKTNNQNETGLSWKKTSVFYINDANREGNNGSVKNPDLQKFYKQRIITDYTLYFGNFHQGVGSLFSAHKSFNLANRNGGTSTNDSNKGRGSCAYNASVWDLVGMKLDKTKTNAMGGYLLQDPEMKAVQPIFDSSVHNLSSGGLGPMYENVNFPFYESTYDDVTTYSYDSLSDYNRRFNETSKTYSVTDFTEVNKFPGYMPISDYDVAFGNEFDIDFYMTATGNLKGTTKDHDICFNFSGDDDVWVFIDGVLVLDLGGDHMPSAASLNLTDMKVYYKTPAKSAAKMLADNEADSAEAGYATNKDYMYVVDLNGLFAANDVTFKKNDPSTKHKLQMFYLERGENESNCSISFNLPQNTGLKVSNTINTDNVNPAFVNDVLRVANNDYFNYTLTNHFATSAETSDINALRVNSNKIYYNMPAPETNFNDFEYVSTPNYPVTTTQALTRKLGIDGTSDITLSKIYSGSGTASDDYKAGGASTGVGVSIPMANINYRLNDAYLYAADSSTAVDPIGRVAAGGTFDLMFNQSADFHSKVAPKTMVGVTQSNTLSYPNSADESHDTIYSTSGNERTVSKYYKTTYTITDDLSGKQIGKQTYNNNNGSNIAVKADDLSSDFYFANYDASATEDDKKRAAMTVDFTNSPNTGDIVIEKKIKEGDTGRKDDVFTFNVEFENIFGITSSKTDYTNLQYEVYDPETDSTFIKTYSTKGIQIKAGQIATITNVPVGTKYYISEVTRSGYDLDSVVGYENGNSVTIGDDNIAASTVSILEPSASSYSANYTFTNAVVPLKIVLKYYDRLFNAGSETQINSSPTSFTYAMTSDEYHDKDWFTFDVDGNITNIDVGAVLTYVEGKADIGNVINDYTFFADMDEAVNTVMNKEYVRYNDSDSRIGNKYSEAFATQYAADNNFFNYHNDYHGHPIADGVADLSSIAFDQKWICYKDAKGDEVADDAYGTMRTVEAWAYNEPKQYRVNYYTLDPEGAIGFYSEPGVEFAGDDTTAPNYVVGQEDNGNSGEQLYNIRVGAEYIPNIKDTMTEQEKEAEYAKARLLNRPSTYFAESDGYYKKKGYTSEYPVTAERFSYKYDGDSKTQNYKFAYWASDPKGENKITTDYFYGYRITKNMSIYPVYQKVDAVDKVGLTLTASEPDFYTSGNKMYRRINTIFNVYGAEPNDPNLSGKDMIVAYVRLGEDPKTGNIDVNPAAIDYEKVKASLSAVLTDICTSGAGTAKTININVTADSENRRTTVYHYSISFSTANSTTVQLNNKNRMMMTHAFSDSLFEAGQPFYYLMVCGAVDYGTEGYKISDNYILYRGGSVI